MANVYKKIKDGYMSTDCLVVPNGSTFLKFSNTLAGKFLMGSTNSIELNLGSNFIWYSTDSANGSMFAVVSWIPNILSTFGFVEGKYSVSVVQSPSSYNVSYQGANKTYTLTPKHDFTQLHKGYFKFAEPGTTWNRYIGAMWTSSNINITIKITKTA